MNTFWLFFGIGELLTLVSIIINVSKKKISGTGNIIRETLVRSLGWTLTFYFIKFIVEMNSLVFWIIYSIGVLIILLFTPTISKDPDVINFINKVKSGKYYILRNNLGVKGIIIYLGTWWWMLILGIPYLVIWHLI